LAAEVGVETVGRRKWAVTDGYIPAWGNGPCPELESRDALQPTLKLPIRIQIWGVEHHTFACSNLAALLERLRLLGSATE